MEIDKLKEDHHPHISGAYIRTLVKQLKPKDQNYCAVADGGAPSKPAGNPKTPPPGHQPHKKQVRRRLHTSRPYQERLLNMAEARREIVTALKFHRAAMKKAADEQQQNPPRRDEPPRMAAMGRSCTENKSRKIPKKSPSSTENIDHTNHLQNFHYPSFPSNSFWSPFSIPPLSVAENLDITLPEQTLGLNLNYQDFNNLDASLFENGGVSYRSYSSSSSSPSLSVVTTDQEAPNSAASDTTESSVRAAGCGGGGLHVAVGDEEMAEMRWIGEKHEVEWSDKMNMVTSARWFRFMKSSSAEEEEDEDGIGEPLDKVLEFPDWLKNGNESCLEEPLMDDYCSDDHWLRDHALPCMDIGEFEGMDAEWLA